MKKIFLFLLFSLTLLSVSSSFAVSIEVTEWVPGAGCVQSGEDLWECNIQNGFSGVTGVIGEIIKYFTYITALASVLFIVINGIMYSMAGINDGLKSAAKDRIINTLIGLALLMLSGVILNIIAPWIYQ